MMAGTRLMLCVATLMALVPAAATQAAEGLDTLVKQSDLIVMGQVVRITPGELDADLLKMDVKFRIDTAVIAVSEVIKGDPGLAGKTVNVVFQGFPKPHQPTLAKEQSGVWLVTKSDRPNAYEITSKGRHLPEGDLAAVRRAALLASGLTPQPKTEDRSSLAQKAIKELQTGTSAIGRRLAAYQLGELGELSAVPELLKALADENGSVRFAAEVALRKLTGYRVMVDFEQGSEAERQRGRETWEAWWDTNRNQSRKEILANSIRDSQRPQPDFEHAVAGLAEYPDLNLLPVFVRAFDQSMAARNNRMLIITARYFGRVRNRDQVPRLISVVDGSAGWASTSARNAAVAAIGAILKKDFGTGREAVANCLEWWNEHRDSFK